MASNSASSVMAGTQICDRRSSNSSSSSSGRSSSGSSSELEGLKLLGQSASHQVDMLNRNHTLHMKHQARLKQHRDVRIPRSSCSNMSLVRCNQQPTWCFTFL
jgi:hypothetical protein